MSSFISAELFCDIVTDGTHDSPKKTENGVKLVTSKNIINNKLDLSSAYYISNDDAEEINRRSKVDINDVLISMIGTVGEACLITEEPEFVIKNVGLFKFKRNETNKSKWLYFYLKSNFAKGLINERLRGTTQQYIPLGELRKLPILQPKNTEHLEYAIDILWTLEEKIQLNIQINQTLEQIAQAIFKSWFIDFDPVKAKAEAKAQGSTDEQANIAAMSVISGKSPDQLNAYKQTHPTDYQQLHQLAQAFPSEFEEIDGVEVPKGWGVETLSEVSSMRNGYAFKSNEWAEEGIPVIKIGSIKPMIVEVEGNGFVSEENKSSRPNFVVKEGDILVGLTGYVGEVGRMPQHKIAMLNQRVAKFIPNKIDNKYSFYSFIYCSVRSSKFKEYATINAKGSAQANISTNELLKYPIIKATDNIHISFEKYVENILDKILKNSGENEFLEKTRDLLLPKLLSGEIAL